MAILVILVLAVLWAAVLLPPILRARNGSGSVGGIGDFMNKLRQGFGHHNDSGGLPPLNPIMGPVGGPVGPMGAMGPVGPGGPSGPVRVPGGMSPQQKRRRDVLIGLLVAVGLTFMMAFFGGSPIFWVLQLGADVALAGYVYLLVQMKHRNATAMAQPAPGYSGSSYPAPAYQQAPGPAYAPRPAMASNVAHLEAHRREVAPSHVEAPREATVLALRRTATY